MAWLGTCAALVACLLTQSTPRNVGDGVEYLAMARNLADGRSPSLTAADRRAAGIAFPNLEADDGRQETMHFWLYPALGVPFLLAAKAVGAEAPTAFLILNICCLAAAATVAVRQLPPNAFVLLFVGPILWWIDKLHTEVFTFSLLTLAFLWARRHLGLSFVALGVAAAQNPPIAGLMLAVAWWQRKQWWNGYGAWLGGATGVAIAAWHPSWYLWRLGRLTPLVESPIHVPRLERLVAPLVDLNIGLVVHAPFLALAMAIAIVVLAGSLRNGANAHTETRDTLVVTGVCSLWLLFSFAQTLNINHGATPGMTRYALWLIPALGVPLFGMLDRREMVSRRASRAFGALAVLSAAWSVFAFHPARPPAHLQPTWIAEVVWTQWPHLTNPVPEIFAERLRHSEPAHTVAATKGCEKVLITEGVWPSTCAPARIPERCRAALCYANKRPDGTYDFMVTARRGGWDMSGSATVSQLGPARRGRD